MSEQKNQRLTSDQLSQLMDGEWHDIDASRSVEAACNDQGLRYTWSRWHLIRDVARGESVTVPEQGSDLASRIRAAIEEEPSYSNVTSIHDGGANHGSQQNSRISGAHLSKSTDKSDSNSIREQVIAPRFAWRRAVAGMGIAASVAVATVLGLDMLDADLAGGAQPSLLANVPTSGVVVQPELPQVELVSNSSSFAVEQSSEVGVRHGAVGSELLNFLLSQQVESSAASERAAMVPYAPLVNPEERQGVRASEAR